MPEAFYVVFNGRRPGLYPSWDACRQQVDGFSGAVFRRFASPEAAARAWEQGPAIDGELGPRPATFCEGAIAVDGACSGNPGPMEYRGVDLGSGAQLFRFGPVHGTNNLGEFLAIVHALALQHGRGSIAPVWSDSRTAIAWVRERRVGSTLTRDGASSVVWRLTERALRWLVEHREHAPVHKWPTAVWGEIPADFGRKGS